jgi:DnaJ homolog subfamily A member 5
MARPAQLNQVSMTNAGNVTPARSRAPLTEYVEQDWQRVDPGGLPDDLEWAVAEGKDAEEWECVACGKTFRSEAAWDSHERSKKHMKEVEKLRRDMQAEDDELNLGEEEKPGVEVDVYEISNDIPTAADGISSQGYKTTEDLEEAPHARDADIQDLRRDNANRHISNDNVNRVKQLGHTKERKKAPKLGLESSTISDDIQEPAQPTMSKNEMKTHNDSSESGVVLVQTTSEPSLEMSKREKRRAKQAERQGNSGVKQIRCNLCKEGFASKTKLFSHINETGHALAMANVGKEGKKGKR